MAIVGSSQCLYTCASMWIKWLGCHAGHQEVRRCRTRGGSKKSVTHQWWRTQVGNLPWLWKPRQTSPKSKVLNRGISGPTKELMSTKNFFWNYVLISILVWLSIIQELKSNVTVAFFMANTFFDLISITFTDIYYYCLMIYIVFNISCDTFSISSHIVLFTAYCCCIQATPLVIVVEVSNCFDASRGWAV